MQMSSPRAGCTFHVAAPAILPLLLHLFFLLFFFSILI